MKPCTGCKFLLARRLCAAKDNWATSVNPYTGKIEYPWRRLFTVTEMRAEGAECGPDAKLWTPNWRRRLIAKFRTG